MKVTDSQHRLLELMSLLNITQQDIADKTGLDKSTVSLYVNGKREPRQDKISIICDAYNLDPAWLMGYDVPMENGAAKRYSEESAHLVSKMRNDLNLINALKIYFTLPDKEKKHVIDFINMLNEE